VRVIAEKLESRVDPFDLDVFSPYIHNHLTRQTQRSNVRTAVGVILAYDLNCRFDYSSVADVSMKCSFTPSLER